MGKVLIFQTLIKELFLRNFVKLGRGKYCMHGVLRRGEHCMHVIYIKIFHKCKDFLFLVRNSQITASCFLRGLTLMSARFFKVRMASFLKSLNLICWKLHHA